MADAVLRKPDQTMAWNPDRAAPAPTRPPISAWELLDGMPRSHVTTFHTMAPNSAAKITPAVTISGCTMPLPTVSATLSPNTRNATKLKKAAQNTASDGLRTRVETMVAIELAASCSPFRKSNARAVAISPTRRGVARGAMPVDAQTCSMTMLFTRSATSSKRSSTFSRCS